jgi:hypothetical protein
MPPFSFGGGPNESEIERVIVGAIEPRIIAEHYTATRPRWRRRGFSFRPGWFSPRLEAGQVT